MTTSNRPTLGSHPLASQLATLARGVGAATLVGFVGNWSGPVVAILALASGITFFDLGRRDRAEQEQCAGGVRDRFGGAMQLGFLAILCAAAWDNRSQIATTPGIAELLGLGVIASGVRLRQSAALALGRHFTVRLSLPDDRQLVSTGPYRWLRHPNYAGLALIALGTATMVRSPTAALVAVGIWLPVMLLRIRDEERALRGWLGAAYAEYARRSWCLLPGVY